jgi:hypothetical protein
VPVGTIPVYAVAIAAHGRTRPASRAAARLPRTTQQISRMMLSTAPPRRTVSKWRCGKEHLTALSRSDAYRD